MNRNLCQLLRTPEGVVYEVIGYHYEVRSMTEGWKLLDNVVSLKLKEWGVENAAPRYLFFDRDQITNCKKNFKFDSNEVRFSFLKLQEDSDPRDYILITLEFKDLQTILKE